MRLCRIITTKVWSDGRSSRTGGISNGRVLHDGSDEDDETKRTVEDATGIGQGRRVRDEDVYEEEVMYDMRSYQ